MAQKTVSIYDPSRDAYFEASLEVAKKYLASLEQVKKAIAAIEAQEPE